MHDDEPDTKKITLDDPSDNEQAGGDEMQCDLDAIRIRKEDEDIIGRAILEKGIHEVYSEKIIDMAVHREMARMMVGHLQSTHVREI